jgi:hypothetical protein
VLPSLRSDTQTALGSRWVSRPFQLLARQAVPYLQLVDSEPRSEPLGTAGYRLVGLLLAWHSILLAGDSATSLTASLSPHIL